MILPGDIWAIEVNLDVESLPSTDNQLVIVVSVCVVINLVAVPSLFEEVNRCDSQVICPCRKQNKETIKDS